MNEKPPIDHNPDDIRDNNSKEQGLLSIASAKKDTFYVGEIAIADQLTAKLNRILQIHAVKCGNLVVKTNRSRLLPDFLKSKLPVTVKLIVPKAENIESIWQIQVSHAMGIIQKLCDRCLLLEERRIAKIGETSRWVQEYSAISKGAGRN